MELTQAEEVEGLIEKLVTSGKATLDEATMKRLKSRCKHSDACLEHTFHILLSQLLKDHSEVRFSAFQITNELFKVTFISYSFAEQLSAIYGLHN